MYCISFVSGVLKILVSFMTVTPLARSIQSIIEGSPHFHLIRGEHKVSTSVVIHKNLLEFHNLSTKIKECNSLSTSQNDMLSILNTQDIFASGSEQNHQWNML